MWWPPLSRIQWNEPFQFKGLLTVQGKHQILHQFFFPSEVLTVQSSYNKEQMFTYYILAYEEQPFLSALTDKMCSRSLHRFCIEI